MAKKSRLKNSKKVLAFDLGGTKIAVGVVNDRGRVIEEHRAFVNLDGGVKSLVEQMSNLALPLIQKHKLKKAAIASAGPLDPIMGTLLNPTNLKSKGQVLGVVPLVREVSRKIKLKVNLENDAAAAVLAESWVGVGRKHKNVVSVTLGTGLGVGVVANGQLLRAGRNLHTEAGHICIDQSDRAWACGCGNYGCAESFLSGTNFIERLKLAWGDSELTGEKLLERAAQGDTRSLQELNKYGERLGNFLYSLVVTFCPEIIILSGGFSHACPYFMPPLRQALLGLLKTRRQGVDLMPRIELSKFQDDAGLIGAGFVALNT